MVGELTSMVVESGRQRGTREAMADTHPLNTPTTNLIISMHPPKNDPHACSIPWSAVVKFTMVSLPSPPPYNDDATAVRSDEMMRVATRAPVSA